VTPATYPRGDQPPTPAKDIDWLMGTAVHELGHVALFSEAGIRMLAVEARRHWSNTASGVTEVNWNDMNDPTKLQGLLLGIVAGGQAKTRWLMTHHGWPPRDAWVHSMIGARSDLEMFRHYSQGRMSIPDARRRADTLLKRCWPRIERGANILHRRRSVKASQL
jgi:hypothetical protein